MESVPTILKTADNQNDWEKEMGKILTLPAMNEGWA